MKIAIHIPVFQRLKITNACYKGVQRNIIEFAALGYEVEVYIAGHEPEHEALAKQYGWNWLQTPNHNLGEKNQALYVWMKTFEWDYLLQLGSDDFILPGGVKCILKYMEDGYEFACFTDLYFFRLADGEGTLLKGYPCGAGRFISRRICDGIRVMWTFAVIGNDGRSADRIFQRWKIEPHRMKGAFVADIKSDVNVTPFFRHSSDMYCMDDIVPEYTHLK
jgi:hypothetical protein